MEEAHKRIIDEFRQVNLEGVLKEIENLGTTNEELYQYTTTTGEDHIFKVQRDGLTVIYTDSQGNTYNIEIHKEKK